MGIVGASMISLVYFLISNAQADQLLLRVAIDDRAVKLYSQPKIRVGEKEAQFLDDGAVPGDVPSDRIWVATLKIERLESVQITVNDSNLDSFSLQVELPEQGDFTLQLKSQEGESPLVIDYNAPQMPEVGAEEVSSLIVSAAPVEDAERPLDNKKEIRFLVDDRSERLLNSPRVRTNQSGVPMVPLVDDGRVLGDTPNDGIYHSKILIRPTENLTLTVEDQGQVLGQVGLSLPQSSVVAAGVQISTSGLDLLENVEDMASTATVPTTSVPFLMVPTEVVNPENVPTESIVTNDLVVQASALEGEGPQKSKDGDERQWLVVMFSSDSPLVMPTFRVGEDDVLLSDDGQLKEDLAGDGIYVGRSIVPRGEILESTLIVDGQEIGGMTIFLPDSTVAQAVARVDANGLGPFDRLAALQKKADALPTVFRAAGVLGTELVPNDEGYTTVNLDLLVKSEEAGEISVQIFEGDNELANQDLKLTSNGLWKTDLDLPRSEMWFLQFKINDKAVGIYVLPPEMSLSTLGLLWNGQSLSAITDVDILGASSQIDEIRVLRAEAISGTEETFNSSAPTNLKIYLDDRVGKMLKKARVWVEGTPSKPSEVYPSEGTDGEVLMAGIHYADLVIPSHTSMVQIGFQNGDKEVQTAVVILPSSNKVELRSLVTPNGLKPIKAESAGRQISTPLVVQAAPTGTDFQEGNGENKIQVTMILDDRILQKLENPRLRVLQSNSLEINLLDDGKDSDEKTSDKIFSGQFSVEQTEFMKVAIDDNGSPIGEMTVFLPSSSSARIRMRTTDDSSGLKLVTEAIATGGGDAPTPVVTSGNGAASVGIDRLAHVIWVGLALFGLLFSYVRHTMFTRWENEVVPLLTRLDRFLSQNEDGPPPNQDEDNA